MTKSKRKSIRGRFWHFINRFWEPNGYFDSYSEEYIRFPGFTSKISSKDKLFKNSFPYKLTLSQAKSKYYLSIEICLSCSQKKRIFEKILVPNKKEAIREAIKLIRQFENSEKSKQTWLSLRHQIPIVKDDLWIASCIVGSEEQTIYIGKGFTGHYELPLGYGKFYSIHKDFKSKWYWKKIETHSCGYSSGDAGIIDFKIWKSIYGFNEELDEVISKAISFYENNKFVMIEEKQIGPFKAQQLLDMFYNNQERTCSQFKMH